MPIESMDRHQNSLLNSDGFTQVDNENYSATLQDRVLRVASDTSAVTITLPNAAEYAGRFISIIAPDGGTNTVTVTDKDGSVDFQGDYSLNAADDGIVLFSDGLKWWEVATS